MPALASARRAFGVVTAHRRRADRAAGLAAVRRLAGRCSAARWWRSTRSSWPTRGSSTSTPRWPSGCRWRCLPRWPAGTAAGWWSLVLCRRRDGTGAALEGARVDPAPLVPSRWCSCAASGRPRASPSGVTSPSGSSWPSSPTSRSGRRCGRRPSRRSARCSDSSATTRIRPTLPPPTRTGSGVLFYPLVLLFRSTPLTWLGLLGLLVARPSGLARRSALALLVFALGVRRGDDDRRQGLRPLPPADLPGRSTCWPASGCGGWRRCDWRSRTVDRFGAGLSPTRA